MANGKGYIMSKIIKQDTDGNAFAVVTDIAKYCEVSLDAVQKLITRNVELFDELPNRIIKNIKNRTDFKSDQIKIPRLELVEKENRNEIDWNKVKLYQPHVELLLALMKNTKQVKEHKANLIADFFATKFELALMKQKEQQRLIKQLQKQVDKLEKDKFIDWGDEWITASMYIAEHKELGLSATELLDTLSDANLINTEIKTRQVRSPNGNESIYGKKGVLLIKKKEIDKLFNL
jgi:hypothetical protein